MHNSHDFAWLQAQDFRGNLRDKTHHDTEM